MEKVPTMISTKDLSYLSDIFEWNFTASKKTNHYYEEVMDPEIKDIMKKISYMHQKICNEILNILN